MVLLPRQRLAILVLLCTSAIIASWASQSLVPCLVRREPCPRSCTLASTHTQQVTKVPDLEWMEFKYIKTIVAHPPIISPRTRVLAICVLMNFMQPTKRVAVASKAARLTLDSTQMTKLPALTNVRQSLPACIFNLNVKWTHHILRKHSIWESLSSPFSLWSPVCFSV